MILFDIQLYRKMAAYERDRQGVSAETVCKGLCDLDIYNSFEKGRKSVISML